MLYELEDVTQAYGHGGQAVRALRGVSLRVERGEFLAIAGPSGSGKTTLLNLMGLIDAPRGGELRFDGQDVTRIGERTRTRLRRLEIGLVLQAFHLVPVLTARENVEYFLLKQGMAPAATRRRVDAALEAVGIESVAHRRPGELSGGEQQRTAIARALVREPRVVLADEPTAALDHETGLAVIELMKRLNRERGVTVIFSSHDPRVLTAAARIIALDDGRIAA